MSASVATAVFKGGPLDGRHDPLVVSDTWTPGMTVGVFNPEDPDDVPAGRYFRLRVMVHAGAIIYEYEWDEAAGGAA